MIRPLKLVQRYALSAWCSAFIAVSALVLPIQAADPYVLWAMVVGGPDDDVPAGAAMAPSGELHIVNIVFAGPSPPQSFLRTFDRGGKIVQSQACKGTLTTGIAIDSKGNYYLTGGINQPAIFGFGHANDFFLAKYTPEGDSLWVRTGGTANYSRNWASQGFAVAVDVSGNVYAAGGSSGPATFGDVAFGTGDGPLLCKYASDGTLLWAKRVNQSRAGAYAQTMALDQNGNVVIGGFIDGPADFGGTPSNGDSFSSSTAIGFTGTASSDGEDWTSSLVWTSSIDGVIGTGGAISATLSDGTHTIIASVADSVSTFGGFASITIVSGQATPAAKQLLLAVWTEKLEYTNGELMRSFFLATADDDGDANTPAIPVAGATVSGVLTDAKGATLTTRGTTGPDGIYEADLRINRKANGVGTYSIEGTALMNGYLTSEKASTSFLVK